MKKILIVFGTRPEAIKMASVVKEFQKHKDSFTTKVCVSGQHREMLDQVLDIFNIRPSFDLNIMKTGQDLYDVTSKVILGMRNVLKDYKPDIVLVHGDTTTSSMAALAAFYEQIPVGHVEAGLRTNNIYSPWPEEMNRQITGRIATFHFAPTEESKLNLLKEVILEEKIIVTGNTVIDALYMVLDKIDNSSLKEELNDLVDIKLDNKFNIFENDYILVTGHRRENFGQGFLNICEALKEIALTHPEKHIIYPVHLNPNVQTPVFDLLKSVDNIHLLDPLDYLPFIYIMSNSYIVLTDSGGIQEEAPSLGKPVLVMRDTTERPEAIESGTVILVGTNKKQIVNNVNLLIEDKNLYEKMSKAHNPYGDGKASQRILDAMLNYFQVKKK